MDDARPEGRRLFAAVDVPRAVARAVADATEALRARSPQARWTDPAGWHLTLAFLGSVPAGQVPAIEAALTAVAGRHAPIHLALTGQAGMFGRRVLWTGIDDSDALAALAADVGSALEPLGFPREKRSFHAHLTLARARKGGALPRGLADTYEGPRLTWTVRTLDLMRSHLERGGARYDRVVAWSLGSA